MSYPLDFATFMLESSDGNRSNKFYSVSLVHSDTIGNSILVRRWGKIGQIGEMKIERFAVKHKAETEFEKLVQSKINKGYVQKSTNIKQLADEAALRMAFGPSVWPMLPGPALEHVVPDMDTSGRKKALNPPRFSEDGNFIGDPAPRTYSKAEIERARQVEHETERAEAAKVYSSNPRFGLF